MTHTTTIVCPQGTYQVAYETPYLLYGKRVPDPAVVKIDTARCRDLRPEPTTHIEPKVWQSSAHVRDKGVLVSMYLDGNNPGWFDRRKDQ